MSLTNEILNLIYDEKLSINQLCKIIDKEPKSTIYGRLSELKSRKLIKKISGKFITTDSGKMYIDNIVENSDCKIKWNYKVNKKLKILVCNKEQADKLAKLIYGSNVYIKQIG
jgi:hypothetical protein